MDAASQVTPTDDWQQRDLLVRFPEQRTDELIRSVVLFGRSPAERARQTGAPQRTLARQAAWFEREGMASLFGPPKIERHRTLPEEIQRAILALKAEYPPFRPHEIATICGVRFRRRPNHHYQVHWAHRERADDRRRPVEVLGWVGARQVTPEGPHRLFYRTRFGRTLDRMGYLRFRHLRVYGEQGLARDRAAVWLYGETLTIEFADEPLAQYRVRYQSDKMHLRAVEEPRVFETAYRSPQLALWALNDTEWLKVIRRPDDAPRKPRQEQVEQPELFALGDG